MDMVVSGDDLMFMAMNRFIFPVNVGMGMNVAVLMDVLQIAVFVKVVVGMGVLMGVLEADGIPDHQHRCPDHNGKANVKLQRRPFSQQQHTKGNSQEGCD